MREFKNDAAIIADAGSGLRIVRAWWRFPRAGQCLTSPQARLSARMRGSACAAEWMERLAASRESLAHRESSLVTEVARGDCAKLEAPCMAVPLPGRRSRTRGDIARADLSLLAPASGIHRIWMTTLRASRGTKRRHEFMVWSH
jgi:hypothetical protein